MGRDEQGNPSYRRLPAKRLALKDHVTPDGAAHVPQWKQQKLPSSTSRHVPSRVRSAQVKQCTHGPSIKIFNCLTSSSRVLGGVLLLFVDAVDAGQKQEKRNSRMEQGGHQPKSCQTRKT